jgi:hypothetical protein
MSFFNSKPWAKIPTDLLENKAMIRTEKELAPELRAAPVLLYLAGATKADEDGIFDIGDGEEFAALIKADKPETVFAVASAMVKFRIFAHVPDSTIYLFAEWEYTTRQNGKALENRFNIARSQWEKKQKESSFFAVYNKVNTQRKNIADTSAECLNTIQPRVNECSNTIRPAENANPQIRREQIRETRAEQNISELEKTTHTRVEGVEGEIPPAASEPIMDSPAAGSKMNQDFEQMEAETKDRINALNVQILPEDESSDATDSAGDNVQETEDASFVPKSDKKNMGELVETLQKFFAENNAGYNASKGLKTVEQIADELLESADTPEKAADLARKMCFEFKKMHDAPEGDRWHNVPLFPAYMAKEAIWSQLLSRVSRIYGTVKEPKPLDIVAQAEKDRQEVLAEREEFGDQFDAEYIRYGIDPKDPNRSAKLFQAKMKSNSYVEVVN